MKQDSHFLLSALEISKNCKDVAWYGVGSIIVGEDDQVLATGYTGQLRDLDGTMQHAEEIAILSARQSGCDLTAQGITLYSTIEPCSERASKKISCCSHIVTAGIRRVVYGAKEPFEAALGINCRGHEVLEQAGVSVIQLSDLADQCLAQAVSSRRSAVVALK